MRRLIAATLAPLAVAAAVAGCSSSPAATGGNQAVTVTGPEGKSPTVHIPARRPSHALVTKTLVEGHGQKLTTSDSFLANFNLYLWRGKTNKLLFSSFTTMPQVFPVSIGLPGLQKAVAGQRVGARVLAVLPPKYAYGSQGNAQIGVGPTDTLVWVVDLLHAFPANASATGKQVSSGGGSLPAVHAAAGTAPQIQIPKTAPPPKLVVKTLIKGTGPAVKAGQSIVVRYVASIWRTRQVFNDNWPSTSQPTAPPTAFKLGQLIPAWNTGLVGIPVGSRVMLVVPPAEGYGKRGNTQAGIKGTDTLVFVLDILAATS
jgi:FKBP-type peptidyl-prolyl cis-trans isomerase